MVPFLSIPVVIFNSTMTAEHEHSTVHIATGMRYKFAKPSSESVEAPQKISSILRFNIFRFCFLLPSFCLICGTELLTRIQTEK